MFQTSCPVLFQAIKEVIKQNDSGAKQDSLNAPVVQSAPKTETFTHNFDFCPGQTGYS